MKSRARRITIGVAVLGMAVIAVPVLLNWSAVRDHIEVWRFMANRETHTLEPLPPPSKWVGVLGHTDEISTEWVLRTLADFSGSHVIFDPTSLHPSTNGEASPGLVRVTWTEASPDMANLAIKSLNEDGWRVLEQRYPRRAYVVIRGKEPAPR